MDPKLLLDYELAAKMKAEDFGMADAKYAAQRAYNASRGKRMYEQKLSRARRKKPD